VRVHRALGGARLASRRPPLGGLAVAVNLVTLGVFKTSTSSPRTSTTCWGAFGLNADLPLLRRRAAGRHLVPRVPRAEPT